MSKEFNYKISTITISTKIPNCMLNILNIGKYLDIDNTIIGIKYLLGKTSILKGKYSTCIYNKSKNKNSNKINKKLFYNQVSLIINFNNKIVNVKLFENGSLHITGLKNTECPENDATDITVILYDKLLKLTSKNVIIILVKDINNVLLDNENNIYSYCNPHKIIGYKYNNNYYIHKKIYDIKVLPTLSEYETNVFISNKIESKRTNTILNLNGDYIGYSQIELYKNNKKFYKNNVNITYEDDFIFYNSTIIGNIKYTINKNYLLKESNLFIEYNYNCNPFIQKPLDKISFEIYINSINIYFNILYEINPQKLFNTLLKLNYLVQYSPEKYSGIILTYKYNLNQLNGICICDNKCTCNNITFIIFQSGNVLVSGLKSISYINKILYSFKLILQNIKCKIVKLIN